MKKYYLICIVGFLFLSTPIALYFLIPRPQIFEGLGGEDIWLGFWGSYLGGVFTAIFGMLSLFHSNKQDYRKLEVEYKKAELSQLENKLCESISIFNISRVQSIVFCFEGDKISKHESRIFINNMNIYCDMLLQKANAFALMYGSTSKKGTMQEKFCVQYNTISKALISSLSNIQMNLTLLIDDSNNIECKDYYERIIKENKSLNNLQPQIQQLFNIAQEWLESERNTLSHMQEELKL